MDCGRLGFSDIWMLGSMTSGYDNATAASPDPWIVNLKRSKSRCCIFCPAGMLKSDCTAFESISERVMLSFPASIEMLTFLCRMNPLNGTDTVSL
jgi:hypothetical protein